MKYVDPFQISNFIPPSTHLSTHQPTLISSNSVPSKIIMYVDYSQCRIVDVMITQMFAFEWVLMPVDVTCNRLALAS